MNYINLKQINDQMYSIPIDSFIVKHHFDNGNNYAGAILHQFNDLAYYKKYIDSTDKIIVDVGANIGLFSLHVLPYAEKIIGLEPTPEHFSIYTELTKSFPNIIRLNKALSAFTGKTIFYTSKGNTTMNSLINRGEDFFEVDTITLLDLINNLQLSIIDFIKIDIEGSESIALTDDVIKDTSSIIKKWFVEFHDIPNRNYMDLRNDYTPIFQKYGYEAHLINNDAGFYYKN